MGTARAISFAGLLILFSTSASALPLQMRGDTSGLNEAVYTEPELMEALARSYGALEWTNRNERSDTLNLKERNLDRIGGGNLLRRESGSAQQNRGGVRDGRESRLTRPSRQGLDSLSGATFGESKRFDSRRKPELSNLSQMDLYNGAIKRNIDEIDRAGFDSFSKRNFDEIDRAGWDSFVKRRFVDAYLASRQH